jgi:hypothetical protein
VPKCALLRDTATFPYALLPWHHCHRPLPLFSSRKVILDCYSVKCLVRWIVGRTGKLGRDVVKTLIIKLCMAWSSRPLIIRLFPDLDYHESVILQKTSLKGLILIIKSTYQGWYHSLVGDKITDFHVAHTPKTTMCFDIRETLVSLVVWRVQKSYFLRRSRFVSCVHTQVYMTTFLFIQVQFRGTYFCMWDTPIRTWSTNELRPSLRTHVHDECPHSWSKNLQDGVSNDPETFSCFIQTFERVYTHTKVTAT